MYKKVAQYPWAPIQFIVLFLVLQMFSTIGQLVANEIVMHNAIDRLQYRLALDIGFLDVGNEMLHTPANKSAVSRYLRQMNTQLEEQHYPIRIASLKNIKTDVSSALFPHTKSFDFDTAEQKITFTIRTSSVFNALSFSFMALTFAIVLTPLFALTKRNKETNEANALPTPVTPTLIINLKDKTLGNGVNEVTVTLQNKPLCFYTALVQFCAQNPTHQLQPHKDIPNELTILANKTFTRLIELGHTKRKRPDFNANLDKTLSEIRATLDEVFADFPIEKKRYYPPRAQGEGSRSKQHSYTLTNLHPNDFKIIGN